MLSAQKSLPRPTTSAEFNQVFSELNQALSKLIAICKADDIDDFETTLQIELSPYTVDIQKRLIREPYQKDSTVKFQVRIAPE